ncbi:MAG: glycosyltransferase family 4 protein [Hungatella sp.]|nr:glycosyltransferase family 4 protein [Hungatella sp.]
MISKKIRVCFIVTACKKSGPIQQILNIIKNLKRDEFEPILFTIYPEADDGSSQLGKYLKYVKHYYIPISKAGIIFGRTKAIKAELDKIKPDLIYSLGVFPDYLISNLKNYPHVITLRNYVWDDYPAKYGRVLGTIMAKLHLHAIKHTDKVVTCSQSLSRIYKERLGLDFDFIRNGVDLEQYEKPADGEKSTKRKKLGLPDKAFIYTYSGQIIERKNQRFLLEVFSDNFKTNETYLLILGDGSDYQALKSEYGNAKNIDFRGNVDNVNEYLKACDAYVSTSISEGMPNGVLEAMATGLPVVLSDIEQHREVINADDKIGFVYKQGDKNDLAEKMKKLVNADYKEMSKHAVDCAYKSFDAKKMSERYQELYSEIVMRGRQL